MKRELKELKQQKSDLVSNSHSKRSPSPKTNGFIKENEKLQVRRKFPSPRSQTTFVRALHNLRHDSAPNTAIEAQSTR
jgi:hypothetical protein